MMLFWPVPPQVASGRPLYGGRPAATGGDSWGLGATLGTTSCSLEGEDMAGLPKWCKVTNEVVKQQQHLCHHFCTRRSTGFINRVAAGAVFV